VSRDGLAGKPWVADFIFTRCGSVCPTMTSTMAWLQERAPREVGFVSFTIDPAYDTPEVLARYASEHHAKPGWIFATGPEAEILDLALHGFHLGAGRVDGPEGGLDHSTKLALVDPEGVVRGYYDGVGEASRRRLLRDAALVGRFGRLPRVDAALNGASAFLLALGFLLARGGRLADHRNCMIAALLTSALFLAGYLTYHSGVGSVRFPGTGSLRAFYLALLASHTVLAIGVLPLIVVTVWRAARSRFEPHRRLARLTLPVWAYVSVTGVVVYAMLYLG
jgi:uncharacterized membrane protein YozB (DUF420 family)